MRTIDHLVYAVPDLNEAISQFEAQSGIRPVIGGRHLDQGTKNALVNLGEGCYLELLAVDEMNTKVVAPRWMGIDLISTPGITRWAIRSSAIQSDSHILKSFHSEMGTTHQGQRHTPDGMLLKWEMILPLATPAVELIPFMCDWQHSEIHPTDRLPEQCRLLDLEPFHPNPDPVNHVLAQLKVAQRAKQADTTRILVTIDTPRGIIQL